MRPETAVLSVFLLGRCAQVEPQERQQLLASEGLSVVDRAMALVGQQKGRYRIKGDGIFTRSLGARLMMALGRNVHDIPVLHVEGVLLLCAQVVSLLIGEDGKGLRKLTAQELVGFASCVSRPMRKLGMATEALRHVEVECLRRGLDKFKAADLADLTTAFRAARHSVDTELVEAIQERVMRRGYLTKGRGGQTSPKDVVRLYKCLRYLHRAFELQPAIFDRIQEVMMRDDFLECVSLDDLVTAMTLGRLSDPVVNGLERGVWLDRIVQQLLSRMENSVGQEAYDPSVTERWLKLLAQLTKEERSPEVLAVSRRLIEAWAAAVEGGHHDMSEPYPFYVHLEICYRVGLLGVQGTEHLAKVLNEELVRLLRADGLSSIDPSNSGGLPKVLRLWRGLGYYPGHDMVDMLLDRILSMGGMRHSVWAELLCVVVQHAERLHGYQPKAGFADRMLEILSLAPFKNVSDVHQMCASIELLCKSSSVHQAQQPVVKGFIRRIGDPEALVERVCGGPSPAWLMKLNGALDRLEMVASGGEVAK
jgi:hypothetical protein